MGCADTQYMNDSHGPAVQRTSPPAPARTCSSGMVSTRSQLQQAVRWVGSTPVRSSVISARSRPATAASHCGAQMLEAEPQSDSSLD
jgi:hypothetical protein